jgi:transposase
MKLYVGLDVGLEETSLCIVDSEGFTLREASGAPDHCRRSASHARFAVDDAQQNRSQRSRGIAQMMRLGWYRAVHVKNIDMQKMRTLLTSRKLLKRKLIDLENHIRGALRAYVFLVGAVARGVYEARVRELIERSDPIFVMTIEAMLDVRRAILEGYDRLHRVLLQVVQHDAVCRRLMTVPGVGPVAALSFKVGVDDPRRFARSRTVGAHFGLTPAAPVRHVDRLRRPHQQTGRRRRARGALRSGRKPAAAGQEMVGTASLGPADSQTVEHVVRDHRGRAQARKHSASDVGQRDRFHVGFGAKVTQRLRLKPAR